MSFVTVAIMFAALSSEPSPSPATPAPSEATTAATAPERPHTLYVGLGFSHWYGNTFGAPAGFTTPGLNLAVKPGLTWLEVTATYALAVKGLPLPDGTTGLVGFALAGLSVTRELKLDRQRMGLACGLVGGLVHVPLRVGAAMGARLKAHYLIEVAPWLAIGPAFELRAVVYGLPGSSAPFVSLENGFTVGHSDAHIDLSVMFAFW